jgi:hypothetical protein
MDLYCIAIKVTPAVYHPQFFEWTDGVLNVWLFADSFDRAALCAVAVVRQLPYEMHDEVRGGLASQVSLGGPDFEDGVHQKTAERLARDVGLALLLWHDEFGAHRCRFVSTDSQQVAGL